MKAINFIKRYFPQHIFFAVKYVFARLLPQYNTNTQFYSDKEFFEEVEKGRSFIRLGDGEIGILHGIPIHYQQYSKKLEQSLRDGIEKYTSTSPYIICIPLFVNYTNNRLKNNLKENKLSCWLPLKVEYKSFFPKDVVYMDPHFSYYKFKVEFFFDKFLKNKSILFISNQKDIDKIIKFNKKNDYFKEIYSVVTPEENSFEAYDDIKRDIDYVIQKNKDVIIIASCGPLSKLIVVDYSLKGVVGYDIGFGIKYLLGEKDKSWII